MTTFRLPFLLEDMAKEIAAMSPDSTPAVLVLDGEGFRRLEAELRNRFGDGVLDDRYKLPDGTMQVGGLLIRRA